MGKTDTVALVAGGALVDASAELDALELTDPVAADVRGATPAFRGGDGKPILVSALRRVVKAVMQACGRDPNKYGAHSLRIGGATALFAAGASPLVIKTLGRWWSDAYQIYLRACEEQAAAFLVAAGSNEVHALQDRYDDEDPDDLM